MRFRLRRAGAGWVIEGEARQVAGGRTSYRLVEADRGWTLACEYDPAHVSEELSYVVPFQVALASEAPELLVFPGSGLVKRRIERPDPRLGGESIANVIRAVGGEIRDSWCGPCFGQGPDALQPGQRAITSFNRNWQNRMGLGGEGYLASPAVVAASALAGYMASPAELGLEWDPKLYDVR